ncbi:MAG: carboxypeptidase-like regulatory domain-containing protein, partial [Alistipes sp.]|nr:carboxypeptidase-like regulatory domain-containing protein [Alistipes sp.]
MKSIKIILLAVLCALPTLLAADNITNENYQKQRLRSDANITGHVIDKKSGEHVPYVTISVKNTTFGTVSDATGHYLLKNLPVGQATLVAEAVGYKTVEKQVTLKANNTLEIHFTIEEQALSMDEVVVSATRNETNKKNSATSVNVASAKLFENTASTNLA